MSMIANKDDQRIYDAYVSGKMSPEDAKAYRGFVESGQVQIPIDNLPAPLLKQSVFDAYKSGEMTNEEKSIIDRSIENGEYRLPEETSLERMKRAQSNIPGTPVNIQDEISKESSNKFFRPLEETIKTAGEASRGLLYGRQESPTYRALESSGVTPKGRGIIPEIGRIGYDTLAKFGDAGLLALSALGIPATGALGGISIVSEKIVPGSGREIMALPEAFIGNVSPLSSFGKFKGKPIIPEGPNKEVRIPMTQEEIVNTIHGAFRSKGDKRDKYLRELAKEINISPKSYKSFSKIGIEPPVSYLSRNENIKNIQVEMNKALSSEASSYENFKGTVRSNIDNLSKKHKGIVSPEDISVSVKSSLENKLENVDKATRDAWSKFEEKVPSNSVIEAPSTQNLAKDFVKNLTRSGDIDLGLERLKSVSSDLYKFFKNEILSGIENKRQTNIFREKTPNHSELSYINNIIKEYDSIIDNNYFISKTKSSRESKINSIDSKIKKLKYNIKKLDRYKKVRDEKSRIESILLKKREINDLEDQVKKIKLANDMGEKIDKFVKDNREYLSMFSLDKDKYLKELGISRKGMANKNQFLKKYVNDNIPQKKISYALTFEQLNNTIKSLNELKYASPDNPLKKNLSKAKRDMLISALRKDFKRNALKIGGIDSKYIDDMLKLTTESYSIKKKLVDNFGLDKSGNINIDINNIVPKAISGDYSYFNNMMDLIPPQYRGTALINSLEKNSMSKDRGISYFDFGKFVDNMDKMKENTRIYNYFKKNIGPENLSFVSGIYDVSKSMYDIEKRMKASTGYIPSNIIKNKLEVSTFLESLMSEKYLFPASSGIGAAVGYSLGNIPGAITGSIIMNMAFQSLRGERNIKQLQRGMIGLSNLLRSKYFKQMVVDISHGKDIKGSSRRLSKTEQFKKYFDNISDKYKVASKKEINNIIRKYNLKINTENINDISKQVWILLQLENARNKVEREEREGK